MKLSVLGLASAIFLVAALALSPAQANPQKIAKFKGECLSQKGTLVPVGTHWKCTLPDGKILNS